MNMKKIISCLMVGVACLTVNSCYNDSFLNERMEGQENKLAQLDKRVHDLEDALAFIKDAEKNGLIILNVEDVMDGEEVIGWTISFSDGSKYTLYNGKDGEQGPQGEQGEPGSGESVTINVEDGGDYWTVTIGETSYVFAKLVDFSLAFDKTDFVVSAGQTVKVAYSVAGVQDGDKIFVEAVASGNWKAAPVQGEDAISVTAPDPFVEGKVIVVAANGRGKSDMKALYFTGVEFTVVNATTTTPVSADGASEVEVTVTSNVDYTVSIPAEATWITLVETKSLTKTLVFALEKNTGAMRSATISLLDSSNIAVQTFEIVQAGNSYNTVTVTLAEGEAEGFEWQGNEVFSVRLSKNNADPAVYDRWVFYAKEAAADMPIYATNNGSFGPLDTWNFGKYIAYPLMDAAFEKFQVGELVMLNGAEEGAIRMNNGFYGTAEHPMQCMPLLGVQGEGRNYSFHAVTGFLAVTATGLSKLTSQVELYAPGKKLWGNFVLSGEPGKEYIAMAESEASYDQRIYISYSDMAAQTTFIFPVAVGTLPAGTTISLIGKEGDPVGSMSLPEDVTISRNTLTTVDDILEQIQDFSATYELKGNSAQIEADVTLGESATACKLILADTEDAAKSLLDDGSSSAIATLTESAEVTLKMDEVAKSGQCALVIRTYDGTEVKEEYTQTLYILKPDDAATLCKKHNTTGGDNYTGSYTFQPGDIVYNNLWLTEFDGINLLSNTNHGITAGHRLFTVLYWLKNDPGKWAGSASPEVSKVYAPDTIYNGSGSFSFTVGNGTDDTENWPIFEYGKAEVIIYSVGETGEQNLATQLNFVIDEGYVDVNGIAIKARFNNPETSVAKASATYATSVKEVRAE